MEEMLNPQNYTIHDIKKHKERIEYMIQKEAIEFEKFTGLKIEGISIVETTRSDKAGKVTTKKFELDIKF